MKIEVVVEEDMAERVVDAIKTAAQTGRIGDGKIFISSIDEAIVFGLEKPAATQFKVGKLTGEEIK